MPSAFAREYDLSRLYRGGCRASLAKDSPLGPGERTPSRLRAQFLVYKRIYKIIYNLVYYEESVLGIPNKPPTHDCSFSR